MSSLFDIFSIGLMERAPTTTVNRFTRVNNVCYVKRGFCSVRAGIDSGVFVYAGVRCTSSR